jgi:lysyl-tRNA synthetase class II
LPGDVVRLRGDYCERDGEVYFIGEDMEVLSKCFEGRKSNIIELSLNVREIINLRADVLKRTRNYFDSKKFLEITSPVLLPFYEGGNASPFKTVDMDGSELFLKETNELVLRRLISCGVGPVYEIGKSFRNIGINKNSLQEFSVVESAIPYAKLDDGIDFSKELLKHIFERLGAKRNIWENEWRKLDFPSAYFNLTGKVYTPKSDYFLDRKDLAKVLSTIKGTPTFLTGLPLEISPINSKNNQTLNESVLVIDGDVYCDICEFETSKKNLEERLGKQEKRTGRINEPFLNFAEKGLVPGVGIAFGLERWIKYFSGIDISELKNLGGIL